jgi:hypothetical protein
MTATNPHVADNPKPNMTDVLLILFIVLAVVVAICQIAQI